MAWIKWPTYQVHLESHTLQRYLHSWANLHQGQLRWENSDRTTRDNLDSGHLQATFALLPFLPSPQLVHLAPTSSNQHRQNRVRTFLGMRRPSHTSTTERENDLQMISANQQISDQNSNQSHLLRITTTTTIDVSMRSAKLAKLRSIVITKEWNTNVDF